MSSSGCSTSSSTSSSAKYIRVVHGECLAQDRSSSWAAPHANQFVDPLILMRTVRQDAGRRISFLIAAKSMKRLFVGLAARLVGSVSVGRALDATKPATGRIYLPDPEEDPTLIKGIDTDFMSKEFMTGGLIVLPSVDGSAANAEIQEIPGPDELRLKKPFKGDVAYKQLTGVSSKSGRELENGHTTAAEKDSSRGISFKVAPHVDQSAVYAAVFDRIKAGGCIGIFPEGGSHDRTELLPLKAGVAIMALGAMAEDPTCNVKIVPVGMNYFHAHKFRSRAVVEFGTPISVSQELLAEYNGGNRREATGKLLEEVYNGLSAVTTLAPDYDTLMLIQAVRRLYNPKGKRLPLSQVVELNRRLMKGYNAYKDDTRVVSLRQSVLDYNKRLFALNVRDHQLSYARFPWYWALAMLFYRLSKLAILGVAALPGTILFAPVFIAGKLISIRKSREALKASTVKIKARDVIATWKILVSLALAPTLEIFYTAMLVYWNRRNHCNGFVSPAIPHKALAIFGLIFFPSLCFLALRFGEIGMDIAKSLRPLVLSLDHSRSRNTLENLRALRAQLQEQVNGLINELGPELFPDFDQQRVVQPDGARERSRPSTPTHRRQSSDVSQSSPSAFSTIERMKSMALDSLPRNESFANLGSIGLFASRPATPHRSRSRTRNRTNSGSIDFKRGLKSFTALHETQPKKSRAALDEVSRNLQAAMRERGRRRETVNSMWSEDPNDQSGSATPLSEVDGLEMRKNV